MSFQAQIKQVKFSIKQLKNNFHWRYCLCKVWQYWITRGTAEASRSISAMVLKNNLKWSGWSDGNLLQKWYQKFLVTHLRLYFRMILYMIVIDDCGYICLCHYHQKLGLYGIMQAQGIYVKKYLYGLFSVKSSLADHENCFSHADYWWK